jgi:hypothetical protein
LSIISNLVLQEENQLTDTKALKQLRIVTGLGLANRIVSKKGEEK